MIEELDINKLVNKFFNAADLRLIAKNCNFIIQTRKITPLNFLYSTIAVMLVEGRGSLKDYKVFLANRLAISVSRNALHKKFNANCVSFLQATLEHLKEQIMRGPLGFFFIPGIRKIECRQVTNFSAEFLRMHKLNLFLKIQKSIDALQSNLQTLVNPSCCQTRALSISSGTLIIGDTLEISKEKLITIYDKHAYFLIRSTPEEIDALGSSWKVKLAKSKLAIIEQPIRLKALSKLTARLIAIRIHPGSKHQSNLSSLAPSAKWMILFTNLTSAQLSANRAWEAYSMSWQMQFFINQLMRIDIDSFKHLNSNRIKAEIYLKYLGLGLLMELSSTLLIKAISLKKVCH